MNVNLQFVYKNTVICDFSVCKSVLISKTCLICFDFHSGLSCWALIPAWKCPLHTFCSYLLPISPKEAAVRLVKVRAETRTVKIGCVNIHSMALLWSGSWRYPAGDPAEEWTLKDKKKKPNRETNGGCICKNRGQIWEFSRRMPSLMLAFPWPKHKHQLISIKSKIGIIMQRSLLHKQLAVRKNTSRKRNTAFEYPSFFVKSRLGNIHKNPFKGRVFYMPAG